MKIDEMLQSKDYLFVSNFLFRYGEIVFDDRMMTYNSQMKCENHFRQVKLEYNKKLYECKFLNGECQSVLNIF